MRRIIAAWGLVVLFVFLNSGVLYGAEITDTQIEENDAESSNPIIEFNGHRYQFISTECTWEEAEAYCEEVGGHLVTITSEEEQEAVYNCIKGIAGNESPWIGIYDSNSDGNWAWITDEEVAYTNWGVGKPYYSPTGSSGFRYGTIYNYQESGYNAWGSGFIGPKYSISPGQWGDSYRFSYPFICEWDDYSIADGSAEQDFTIGRDNNIFGHCPENFFEPDESQDRRIHGADYRAALYQGLNNNEFAQLLQKQFEPWDGVCFGISMSMMYAYNDAYSIEKYCSTLPIMGTYYYMDMDYPVNNTNLSDLLEVFHLAQYRSDCVFTNYVTESFLYEKFGIGSDIKSFLEEIVKEAEYSNYKNPFLFGVTYGDSGHAVLICGSEGIEDNYYKIAVCDPNNQTDYIYMRIKSDYTDFYMEGYEGKIDRENFKDMKYVTYEDAFSSTAATSYTNSSNMTDYCKIVVNTDSEFYMTTDNNTYLSYDGDSFDGTLAIDSVNSVVNESVDGEGHAEWVIEFSGVNAIELEQLSENIDIDCLFDDDEYINVTGNNLSAISFEDDIGVTVEGEQSEYEIYIAPKNELDELISVSGKNDGINGFYYDEAEIGIGGVSDLSNLTISQIMENVKVKIEDIDDSQVHIVDIDDYISTDTEINKGDLNMDGKIDLLDLMRCLNHVSKKSLLEGDVLTTADIDKDGEVNLMDLMRVLNYVSKKSSVL